MSLPARSLAITQDDQNDLAGYPYETRLEYVTSMVLLSMCLTLSICGAHNESV